MAESGGTIEGTGITESMSDSEYRQFDITAEPQLLENSVSIAVDSLRTQAKPVRNLVDLVTIDKHESYLQFPLRE